MSGVAIARYLLAHDATLIAEVPATRIQAGTLPIEISLPAISVRKISASAAVDVAQSASRLCTERVQVSAVAKTYPAAKQILALIRDALEDTRGSVNGFDCDSIVEDVEGPDLDDPELGIFEQSQDFIVKFTR